MLTTQPHLLIRRPSPTTVEYTVSTSPHLTIPLRLLLLTTFLLRITLGLATLLLLYARYASSSLFTPFPANSAVPPIFSNDYIWYTLHHLLLTSAGRTATRFSAQCSLVILLPTSSALLYALFLRVHTRESLLVLRGLGIQTSSSAATYLSSATTRFIPTAQIQDILINEAFKGFEVRYYLVIVVKEEENVVVVFPGLLPRRDVVERVWRGARGALYEEEGKRTKEAVE